MTGTKSVRPLYLMFVALCYARAVMGEILHFPDSYQFKEWLISYAGGFIRRGLAGELLFDLCPPTAISLLLPMLLLLCALFVAARICHRLAGLRLGAFWNVALLLSPGLLLFCLQDISCLRREIVCYAVLVASLELCRRDAPAKPKLAAICALTWLMLLIYEPFAVWIPLLMWGLRQASGTRAALIYALAAIVPLAFIVATPSDPKQADLIVSAWRSAFPSLATSPYDPFSYIGISAGDYYQGYSRFWPLRHFCKCLIAGCFLIFLPFALLYSSKLVAIRDRVSFLPPALVILTPLFAMLPLGYDMGRWLNFSGMTALLVLCYFSERTQKPESSAHDADETGAREGERKSLAAWLMLACYLLGWHLKEIGPVVQLGNFDQYLGLADLFR
ncbi:MAG: hypothetical protein IJ523_02540 [Succinivibrionaceae bacterium]|nr:hypothetical protein [Succinivibrionaceae bacterium]